MKSEPITSIMPDLVRRMIAAISSSPSDTAGRISDLNPLAPPVGKPAQLDSKEEDHHEPEPEARRGLSEHGEQPGNPIGDLAAPQRRRDSQRKQKSTTAKMSPAAVSLSVLTARSPMAAIVEVPAPRYEVPKSSWAKSARKLPYCAIRVSLRPRFSRNRLNLGVGGVEGQQETTQDCRPVGRRRRRS